MMYHVVQFDTEVLKEKIVVPSTWINRNNTLCLLPPVITPDGINEQVEDAAEPAEGWRLHSVSSLKAFETYKQAKDHIAKLKRTETLNSKLEHTRLRKRRRVVYYDDPYNCQEDDEAYDDSGLYEKILNSPEILSSDPLIVKVESLPKPKNSSSVASVIVANDTQSVQRMLNELHMEFLNEVDEKCSCNSACHRLMLHTLKRIRQEMEKNNRLLQLVLGQNTEPITAPNELPKNFPIKLPAEDIEEIEELEDYLKESSNFAQTLPYFAILGGNDAKQTMKRIMEELISMDLAPQLNWKGRGSKKPFSAYKRIQTFIFNAVKHNPKSEPITLSDIEKNIKDWLRFAPDRLCLRQKRKLGQEDKILKC